MKIQKSLFNNSFEPFKKFIRNRPSEYLYSYAAEYSACSGVPIIVVYSFMVDLGIDVDFYKYRIKELCEEGGIDLI